MNLTQIVVENDCIWGQSDYSRSQMNDSFLGQCPEYDSCQGQNKEMTRYRVVNDYIDWSELENDPKM